MTTHPNRRRLAVPALLGLGVVAGFGVATTSAAWTNDAVFTAQASAGRVDLRGATDGSSYEPADDAAAAVRLDPITGLTPDAPAVRNVQLWNAGSVPMNLTWSSTNPTSLLGGCVDVTYSTLTTALRPGQAPAGDAVTTATVTFTVADDADAATCSGRSVSDVIVVVQGSTS